MDLLRVTTAIDGLESSGVYSCGETMPRLATSLMVNVRCDHPLSDVAYQPIQGSTEILGFQDDNLSMGSLSMWGTRHTVCCTLASTLRVSLG